MLNNNSTLRITVNRIPIEYSTRQLHFSFVIKLCIQIHAVKKSVVMGCCWIAGMDYTANSITGLFAKFKFMYQ